MRRTQRLSVTSVGSVENIFATTIVDYLFVEKVIRVRLATRAAKGAEVPWRGHLAAVRLRTFSGATSALFICRSAF